MTPPDITTTPSPKLNDDARRQHSRVPLRMSAEVHVGERSFTATTRDLSEGGCGLDLKELLPEKAEVTLGLFLVVDDVEDERMPPLWVKGRVAWASQVGGEGLVAGTSGAAAGARAMAGIRFEIITEQQKGWVRQVLAHLAPTVASP